MLKPLLLLLLLLQIHADVLIAGSSGFSRLAAVLRPNNSTSLAFDVEGRSLPFSSNCT